MHPPVVVPLTKKVDEMFDFFQENNARAAAVLNEFGGVEGFITMKDVLTFIFGQISGEVSGSEHYQERDENLYEVPGDMKLTDFNNLTNFGIEDPRMTTIGGVAFRHLDRLPRVGDNVQVEGLTITIVDMEAHRIARVRVGRGAAAQESASERELDAADEPCAGAEPPSEADVPPVGVSGQAVASAETDAAQATPVAEESESPLEPEVGERDSTPRADEDAPARGRVDKVEG